MRLGFRAGPCPVDSAPPHRASIASGGLLLVAGALALAPASCAPLPSPPPNIVVFVWDTCRADRLSAFGYSRPTTPWLDAFSRDAVRFDRCYAPAPWTSPSHASLFTGLVPHRHGLRRSSRDRVALSIPVLAETLAGEGYETVGFSANGYVSGLTGLDRGFHTFETTFDRASGAHDSDLSREALARWISLRPLPGRKTRPLFLFMNLMDCHLPRRPPRADLEAVVTPRVTAEGLAAAAQVEQRDALAHLLGIRVLDAPTLAGMGAQYDASIRVMDRNTGAMVGMLEKAGLLDDALVVVTADHGENLGEHGQLDHRLSLYDSLLHVPLVVRKPGVYEGGARVASQVSLMDVYATALRIAGVPMPPAAGHDSLPLPAEDGAGRPLLAEFAGAKSYVDEMRRNFPRAPESVFAPLAVAIESARDPAGAPGARKYLRFRSEKEEEDGPILREELYDLVADPGETRDLLREGAPGARAAADRLAAGLEVLKRGTR